MNILQHKSWHVYSQKNQDRVKRDEAKAEVEEKQTQERAIAADREHRLAVLRQRAARRYANEPAPGEQEGDDDTTAGLLAPVPNDTVAVTKTKSKGDHVNFWANLEKQDTASKKGNPEYEAEVKAKEKKWERIIATHLDSAVRGPTPWYIAPQAGSMATSRNKNDDHDFVKVREDPLQNMRSMLDKRKIAQEAKGERERSRSPSSRKRIWTSKQSQPVIKDPPDSNTMAKLRMERLSREQAEKAKAMALLNPDYIDPTVHHQPAGRYNQQFNPQATTHAQSTFLLKFEKAMRVDTGGTAMTDTEDTETQVVMRKIGTELTMRTSIVEAEAQATVRTEVVLTSISTQEARVVVEETETETDILAGHQEAITNRHSRLDQH
ncbi:Leukocyte receptor cluster member 1 [Linnemannia elongata]|nr:Leukocyte receptor cluster member 1 [Linnemannia elongata]